MLAHKDGEIKTPIPHNRDGYSHGMLDCIDSDEFEGPRSAGRED